MKKTGLFFMIDGLDCSGKDTAIRAIIEYLKSIGMRIFDVDDYCRKNHYFPNFEDPNSQNFVDPDSFDVAITSEPTYCLVGEAIRTEVIAKRNKGKYSARFTADCYSIDRKIFYNMVILPLLALNKIILQSRSVSSSIAYQCVQSKINNEDLDVDQIINLEGNSFVLSHPFDVFILPVIKDVSVIEQRLSNREKKDDCFFEKFEFQKLLKDVYASEWYQEIFTSRGVKIELIDAEISVESTEEQAVNIAKKYIN